MKKRAKIIKKKEFLGDPYFDKKKDFVEKIFAGIDYPKKSLLRLNRGNTHYDIALSLENIKIEEIG